MASSQLKSPPVGYRFRPTDQELITHYLKLKNQGHHDIVSNIREINLCKWEPWDLPGHSGSESDDQEWYFFGRKDPKYEKGTRSNRATNQGHWKPTGKDRDVKALDSKHVIGQKKTIVFYRRSQKAYTRTPWIMHEFRAVADKHNPQAFVLYMLKKKPDESTDGAKSIPSSVLPNNVPSNSPTVDQGFGNFPSPDQPLLTDNWNDQDDDIDMQAFKESFGGHQSTWEILEEIIPQGLGNFSSPDLSLLSLSWIDQEPFYHGQSNPVDSPYLEDDDIDMQALVEFFGGHQPTCEGLEEMHPAIPSADVYTSQAHYLNVSMSDPGVTHLQNFKRQEVDLAENFVPSPSPSPETDHFDSESSTGTDNNVPQSLLVEDAVYSGFDYLSESECSDQEYYNDLILAHEVSLSGNSEIIQHVELKADDDGRRKLMFSGVGGSVVSHLRARNHSQVPAQSLGMKKYDNPHLKKTEGKRKEPVSSNNSIKSQNEEKLSRRPEVGGIKSNVELGKTRNKGSIFYAENTRVSNGTIPSANYIMNMAIAIFVMVVITKEILFGYIR